MTSINKRIIVSVTNDLVTDNRVHKTCKSLQKFGFELVLLGRVLPGSPAVHRSYSIKQFRLFFNKGFLFYAEYNVRLFVYLLFSNAPIFLSNDLDTLSANFLAAKIRKKTLVYDSHEYFTEVPELIERPKVQKVWQWLEERMLPHLTHMYTVSASIAYIYKQKYGADFKVIRNLPCAQKPKNKATNNTTKIILYQGALNLGRGLENVILAMQYISGAKLILAGDGDLKTELQMLAQNKNLYERVQFVGRLPITELQLLTPQADLGLSLEEDIGLNYRYALPNKLFDYIMAEVPVLVSNLPEMRAVVEKYAVGEVLDIRDPKSIAKKMQEMLFSKDKQEFWKGRLKIAAKELTWENEEKVLRSIFEPLKN